MHTSINWMAVKRLKNQRWEIQNPDFIGKAVIMEGTIYLQGGSSYLNLWILIINLLIVLYGSYIKFNSNIH